MQQRIDNHLGRPSYYRLDYTLSLLPLSLITPTCAVVMVPVSCSVVSRHMHWDNIAPPLYNIHVHTEWLKVD